MSRRRSHRGSDARPPRSPARPTGIAQGIAPLGLVALMAVSAAVWLAYQYWRLLWGEAAIWWGSPAGAVDLRIFHELVRSWVDGANVYVTHPETAFYPPASYLLLWPILGWLDLAWARSVWATMFAVELLWLATVLTRHCGPATGAARAVVFLLPFSCYASGATVGNGQLGLHVLTAMLAGLLRILRASPTIAGDLLGSALILFAMVKPSMTAPLFWLVVLVPGRLRPALLVSAGYAVVTCGALMLQAAPPEAVMRGWFVNASRESGIEGYADVHRLLAIFNLSSWATVASLAILGATGVWVYLNRRQDVWLLTGVLALVSRLWAHHRWYDDVLVVVAVASAFRLRERMAETKGSLDVLLAAAVVSLLAPGGLYLLPTPFVQLYVGLQVVIWIALLVRLFRASSVPPRPGQWKSCDGTARS